MKEAGPNPTQFTDAVYLSHWSGTLTAFVPLSVEGLSSN
jgi:hypothetical protein